jgi:hypothetical protein
MTPYHIMIVIENEDARRAENVLRLHAHQVASMTVSERVTVFQVTVEDKAAADRLWNILWADGLTLGGLAPDRGP